MMGGKGMPTGLPGGYLFLCENTGALGKSFIVTENKQCGLTEDARYWACYPRIWEWLLKTWETQMNGWMLKLSILQFTMQQAPQGGTARGHIPSPHCSIPSELAWSLWRTPNRIPEPNLDDNPSYMSNLRAVLQFAFLTSRTFYFNSLSSSFISVSKYRQSATQNH